MKSSILIVEDDETLIKLLAFCLEQEDYRVHLARSARELLALLDQREPDLIMLDLGLPDEDGLVVIRQLRSRSATPIVVLSGNQDQDILVTALQLGADDFIRKPFDPRELVLRVRAALASRRPKHAVTPESEALLVHFDGWSLDFRSHTLRSPSGEEVSLTPGEFRVLAALLKRPGWAVSRDQLLDAVTRGGDPPSHRMIDVYITQLRSKIETDRKRPKLIISVRGHGYRFAGTASS